MHRFLVFGGDYYYPCGGWEDFQDSFDSFEEAQNLARKLIEGEEVNTHGYIYYSSICEWAHIVDAATSMKLESFHKEAR
jgi:hypothetical protein